MTDNFTDIKQYQQWLANQKEIIGDLTLPPGAHPGDYSRDPRLGKHEIPGAVGTKVSPYPQNAPTKHPTVGRYGPQVSQSKLIVLQEPLAKYGFKLDPSIWKTNQRIPNQPLPFYFHVTPETYTVDSTPLYAQSNVNGYGTVQQFGGPGLRTFTWDSQFIMRPYLTLDPTDADTAIDFYPTYVLPPNAALGSGSFVGATQGIALLQALRDSGSVVELDIYALDLQVDYAEFSCNVQVTSFPITEQAGEPDARKYSIVLTEARPVRIRSVSATGIIPSDGSSRSTRNPPNTYTVKSSQMGIKSISKAVFGTPNYWRQIVAANGGKDHLTKIVQKGDGFYHPKDPTGPWIFKYDVQLVMPQIPKPKIKKTTPKKSSPVLFKKE